MKLYFVDNCSFIFYFCIDMSTLWLSSDWKLVKVLKPLNDRQSEIYLKIKKLKEPKQSTLLYGDEELLSDHKVIYVRSALGHV